MNTAIKMNETYLHISTWTQIMFSAKSKLLNDMYYTISFIYILKYTKQSNVFFINTHILISMEQTIFKIMFVYKEQQMD
jgi:hypothetical protein